MDMPSSTASAPEKLISIPWRSVPISQDRELSISRAGCRLLSPIESRTLRAFSRLQFDNARDAPFSEAVSALRQMGLLVGEDELLRGLTTGPALPSAEIRSVGVLTRDRPNHLAQCVEALLAAAAVSGREIEIVVIDSSGSAARAANLSLLEPPAARAAIRYCGPAQRLAYRDTLRSIGISQHLCTIASEPAFPGGGFGAARNMLMLDQAGRAFLSADDDAYARPAVHPSRTKTLRLIGHCRPFDLWFFRTRRDATSWARWEPVDIIGEHETLLGQSVAALLASSSVPADLDLACGHFAEAGWNPRVIGTMPGKVGDSGRLDPYWDLWVGNWSDDRATHGRLEIAEMPPSPAIVHDACLMTTMFALDLRSVLPPFPPRHGGEDGAYGYLLSRVIPSACWGIVPHAIFHDRPARGTEEPPPFVDFAQMLLASISRLPARRAGQSDSDAIRAAGVTLIELASGSTPEFRAAITEQLGWLLAPPLAEFHRLSESDVAPGHKKLLVATHDRLLAEFEYFCRSSSETQSAGSLCERFQQELAEYGRLLQHWPEIYRAALELRKSGIRPSIGLGEPRQK